MNPKFSWRKLYVAHIDEHKLISKVLKRSLEMKAPGLVIHSFTDYRNANNALHRRLKAPKHIDLVITNFKHAESEGLQLCRQLHCEEEIQQREHIPVMLLTLDSFSDADLIQLYKNHVIDACMSKTENVESILDAIRNLATKQMEQCSLA
jgi:DNA-binding NarL/FixJ family response regulator